MTTSDGIGTARSSWSLEWAAGVASLPLIALFTCAWLALRETPAVPFWIAASFLLFAGSPAIAGWASLRSRNARVPLATGAAVVAVLIGITTWISLPESTQPGIWLGPTVRGLGFATLVTLPLGWWFSAWRAATRLEAGHPVAAIRASAATMLAILALTLLVAGFIPIA
jgi:hypothetical protein